MAITNVRKISQTIGNYADQGFANITVESGNTSVTASFPELKGTLFATADVVSSAGLQRTGFVVTVSGKTVTVANNGSTTTLASADVVTIQAFSSQGI